MWRSVCLLCLPLMIWTAPVEARKADSARVDSLLNAASDTTRDYKERVKLIKEANRSDRSGRSMHALAKLYISHDTISSRFDASLWLQRAMKREPKNADYRYTYAELHWIWERWGVAYEHAKRAIELDPDHVGALYVAGRYAAWQMMRYLSAERVDYKYDDFGNLNYRIFSMEDFAESDRDEAIGYLTRALSVDAEHRPSRLLLGLVYYEAGMPGELVKLFRAYLERHPDDSDAHFFVGLGYQAQDDLPRAYRAYVKGLARMSEKEQQFMQSVFMLAGRKELEEEDDLPDEEALRRFWTGRDPLFLTPLNERLMEHCGRVAYANLRFGEPLKDIPGWATDKGQAYIRYGRPIVRSVQPAEIDTGVDQPGWYQEYLAVRAQQGTVPYDYHHRSEMWEYEGFKLIFLNTDTRDHWRFGIAWMGNYPMGFSTLIDRIPEYYKDPYGWERYDAPYQIAQFRGEEGMSRVEVYYALPGEEVAHQPVRTGVKEVDLKQGLFLFDAEWDTVKKVVGNVQMMPWVVYDGTREGYLFASERLTLEPGTYFLAAEVEDRATKTIGAFRESLPVQRFGRDSLGVSSLLLARRIVEKEDAPFGREQFLVLPNPLRRCRRDGQAFFYFEVYNLSRDEFGATHYDITYQVRVLTEEALEGEPEWTTAVSHTHRGNRGWEPHYLALDLDGAKPGPRDFRVVIKDLHDQQEAMTSTIFRVMW